MGTPGDATRTVLVCGEVRTGLLPTFEPLDVRAAEQLLRLRADELVLVSKRPNLYALSPETLTGVDCRLPTSNGAKVRAVGTVTARAALTEGRLLQADAYFRVPASGPDERRPWGQYLVRPGVVEPLGKLPQEALVQGVLAGSGRGELDLGLIAEGLLARLLRHKLLVHRTPMKSQRTRLRWVALPAADAEGASIERFTLAEDELRTVRLRVPEGVEPAAVAGLCEDLALHDWLLTTVVRLLDGSRPGSADGADAALALRPAVEHLLHLWMPGARVHHVLAPLWDVLEREPGFSRQWNTLVQRIRDQLAVQAVPLLRAALAPR
ncbi:SCO2521 family protein [Streptomyces sp. NPDC050535]|uniref:SCO2521 family protein n=1 Tax=Streptomyces sp. NPDC050535 TaxID=3365626 RepID=UPI0037B6C70D